MTAPHLDKPARPNRRPSPRAAAKIEQILEGARTAFLEHGFERASINEIARIAGVSKPTLYRYFPDKHHLYAAVFTRECEHYVARIFPPGAAQRPVADALTQIRQRFLERVLSPEAQNAFRVAVGDAAFFPDLAQAFFEAGPARGARHLAPLLEGWAEAGHLEIADIPLAAAQFFELCKADIFYKQILGLTAHPSEEDIDRVVTGAVQVFLRAYGREVRT